MNGNVLVKRMYVLVLALVVFLGGTPLYANANTTDDDIKLQDHHAHWAGNTLERWINQEDLIGYADGTVRPNQVLTRGELMIFINRIFGLEETAELSFSDLSKDSSLYSDVAMAVKAGYVNGRPDGTIGVNEPVTRQEVAVMIARVLGIPEQSNDEALLFKDGDMIATWSKSAISELVKLGILRGYADNSFQPSRSVTRAEAIVSLDRVLAQMEQQYIITKPGIYDFSDIQHTLNWDIIIYSFGVTLRNISIEGDLILSNGVSPQDMNLENTEIKGNTIDRNNVGTPEVTPTPTSNNNGGSNNGGNNNGGEEELALVVNGVGKAVVVTEETASQQIVDAAESLIEYVYKSTGATLPLLDATEAELLTNNELLINVGFIGDGTDDTAITQQLIDLDNDGFVIFPERAANVITIIGPTDWGTEFGIYEFLERFIGVWWLLPGPEGEDVPLHTDILIEEEFVRQEPTFFSRAYDSNIENTVARKAWTRHNRIHNRMDHDHSFWKILPPSQYQSTYPDFYPTNNGLLTSHGGWQICFSVPQTVDVVSDMILDFFEQNPDKDSFSLSVNDNGGFCEQDPTHPLYPNKVNSIGYQDMSNIYFEWVDKVADIVFAQYPDKYIGTIAYHEVYEPPTNVTLHPNVIVYITDERLAWADQDMEVKGKEFTEKWLAAAPGVAFYEYLYGTPYSLPRPYIHQMSENYKYAAEVGVTAQFTELYPNFGEGPKAWIASRLQWDASADVDDLLEEWYTRAVGEEAASYLAAYFEHWENFWEVRVMESTWFEKWVNTNPRRNFMNFYDSTYFKEVTAWDIEYSRSLMDSVVDKAATPEQQARANVLMQAFEYYEASALSYPSDGPIVPITTDVEAENLLDQMIVKLSKAEYRLQLFDSFATHEILQQPLNPRNYGQAWSGIRSKEVDLLIQWVKTNIANDTFKTYVLDTITEVESEQVRNYLKFILAEASDQVALNVNTSFEDGITGSIDDTPPWWYWVDYGQDEDNVHQSDIIARTGNHSIEAVGLKIGGPVVDNIEVSPGFHSLSAYYYVPAGSQSNGNISLFMNFWDANGTHLGNAITTNVLARESAGEWALIEWVGEIPEKIGGVPVKKVQFGANIFDFEDNQPLYLDDFRLLRLSDPYIPEDDDEEESIAINHNSSFEYGNVGSDDALPWSYWIDGAVGTMSRSSEYALTGSNSLAMSGVQLGAMSQVVPSPETGLYQLTAHYYIPAGQSTDGTMKLFMNFRDGSHGHLGAIPTVHLDVNEEAGQWHLLEWVGEIPAEIGLTEVKHLLIGIEPKGFDPEEVIYIDDMELKPYIPVVPLPVNHNSSFEYGNVGSDDALPWSYWIDGGVGTMSRSSEYALTGSNSLAMSGVQLGAMSQVVPSPETGLYQLTAHYYIPAGQSTDGTVKLFMNFRDGLHGHLGAIPTVHLDVNEEAGQWHLLEWVGEIPAEIGLTEVKHLLIGIEPKGFDPGEVIYIDDMELKPYIPLP